MWCALWAVLALCATPAAAVVGGGPAAPPEPDSAVVFVQRHGQSSRLEGIKDDKVGYYSFYGLRYAEPPLGARRFQRPIRRLLSGDILAKKYCSPCPQPDTRRAGAVIGHEDCLCLNVFTPKMPGEERGSPVVFYIHGGNYRSGSTSAYGGQYLTQKDTVLVTAQYRLGSLGFISTDQKDAAGNLGLFDLRAAMIWIRDYIEFFGGDPTRVVVMGQGSGGSAASLMALSTEGRTATGVVALSGAPLSPGAVRPDSAKQARELAKRTGCPTKPVERLLMCLRKLPIEEIIKADTDLNMKMIDTDRFLEEISGKSGAGARVEGANDLRALPPLVEENPADALSKKAQRCPLLTGVTSAETSRAIFGKYSKFLTDRLQTTSDFIKNDVIGGLRKVVSGISKLNLDAVKPATENLQIIPLEDYYQALFENSLNAVDGLLQIAEATGDALFNFPAYQSVQAWSSGGKAYLYNFEHFGNLSRGSHFIPGLPLTGSASNDEDVNIKGPCHGDELAYIFDPLDEEGKSISEEVSLTDARVRDSFVGMIAKFAHELIPLETKNKKLLGLLPFSKDNDQFIKINEEISLDKNFRFCQVGLWGNMTGRITGSLCQNLLGNLIKLPKLPHTLPVNHVLLPSPISTNLPSVVPMGKNLLGIEAPNIKQKEEKANNNKKPGLRLPFGL